MNKHTNPSLPFEGVNLIEFVQRKQKVTSMTQLPALAFMLASAGDISGAEFIQEWHIRLEYYIQAEWEHKGGPKHPIPYPDCVEKGCDIHPWIM